ncbi:MAG: NfeD family protein [Dermatophilus congolensis]|nr:NfeD family protein [Dermatophilus congolensis]
MEWLENNAWAAWLGAALILAGVEAATADLVFLMLAGGALAAAVAAIFLPLGGQVAAGVIVALGLLLLVRPVVKRRMLASTPDTPAGVSAYFGQDAVVVDTVNDHDGRVKIDGEVWSARLEATALPVAPGHVVRVVGVSGATLLVTAVPALQDEAPDER